MADNDLLKKLHKELEGDDLHYSIIEEIYGSPVGQITPLRKGYLVKDKTRKNIWISIGLNASDWELLYASTKFKKEVFKVTLPEGQSTFTLAEIPLIFSEDVSVSGQILDKDTDAEARDYALNDNILNLNFIASQGQVVRVKYNYI
jgi:hypothetical protein